MAFLSVKRGWLHHQPFFDGAWTAAGWGRVKAAQSAPIGLGLEPDSDQAKLHQIEKRGILQPKYRRMGNNVAMTEN